MTLRVQLLLVSLSLLGIPWAGVQFLNANEQALRSLQQQALASTAQAAASGLNDRWQVLYPSSHRLTQPPSDNSLQVQNIAAAPVLDGSFEDWLAPQWRQFGTERRPLHIALARTATQLFIALRTFDDTKHYNASATELSESGDRFVLTFWHQQKRQPWAVSTAAPGGFIGYISRDTSTHPIRGYWSDVADGYQLELSLPIEAVGEHLGINYIDVDEGGESYRGNLELTHTSQPPALVLTPRALDAVLEKFSGSSIQISLVDRWGWVLGRSIPAHGADNADTHGFIQWLYRSLLPTLPASPPPMQTDSGRLITGTAALALQNNPSQRLIHNGETLVAQFAAPITNRDHGVIGAVVVEQAREHYLSLTDSVFEGLFYKGLLAILAVILALLGYAGFLSLRLFRLNAAVSQGLAITDATDSWLHDEIADLAQQFHRLRGEQLRLEAYLRSLPRALAHEIRTPVAVITSTLDNIASAQTHTERSALVNRAKSGLTRLSKLLNAMNEATRLEASVGSEDYETIDLVILLNDLKGLTAAPLPNGLSILILTSPRQVCVRYRNYWLRPSINSLPTPSHSPRPATPSILCLESAACGGGFPCATRDQHCQPSVRPFLRPCNQSVSKPVVTSNILVWACTWSR